MAEVKHCGVFEFKEGIDEEQIANCFAEMMGMVGKIPGLLDMIQEQQIAYIIAYIGTLKEDAAQPAAKPAAKPAPKGKLKRA